MTIDYIEEWTVLGSRYGIEDYDQPGNHFMPEMHHRRFCLWQNGCSFGRADTIEEARKGFIIYVTKRLSSERQAAEDNLKAIEQEQIRVSLLLMGMVTEGKI